MSIFSNFSKKKKQIAGLLATNSKLEKVQQVLLNIQNHYADSSKIVDDVNSCEVILFSKDRAMQLHALLSSYFYFVSNPAPIHILYKCSSEAHQASYDELIHIFEKKNVFFIKENHFRDQLIDLVAHIEAAKMFFMTDDAVFIDTVDLNLFTKFNTQKAVPTLTKGRDLTYCFAFDKPQELPTFINVDGGAPEQLAWKWNSCIESPDWAYPLSVDGTLFNTFEILQLIKAIDFKAPNSLESNLQEFLPFFINRYGICYEKVKYVNVPCNIVQQEWVNISTNTMDVEFLLEKWNEGKRIYFEEFEGADVKTVQKAVYNFVDRT